MIGLLIVDDDPWAVEYLSKGIDWAEVGVTTVRAASNGLKALSAIRAEPDGFQVVVSDVKMDAMDGLTLLNALRAEFPGVKVILLSAYSDLEWVRGALKNGAVDYLFKPVEDQVLRELVRSTILDIQAERKKQALQLEMEARLLNAGELFSQYALSQLLWGQPADPRHVPYWLADETGETYVVLIDGQPCDWQAVRQALYVRLSRAGCAAGLFSSGRPAFICRMARKELAVCLGALSEFPASAGVSLPFWCSDDLWRAHAQAADALWRRFYLDAHAVVYFEEESAPQGDWYRPLFQQALSQALSEGGADKAHAWLERFFDEARKARPARATLQMLSMQLEYQLSESAHTRGTAITPGSGAFDFLHLSDMQAHFDRLIDLCLSGQDRLKPRRLVAEAMEMAERSLDTGITLDKLAQAFHMHPAYLSRLFRDSTGKTFTHFLMERRIEKAKALLADPTLKIYEISRMVGYENPKYFNKVFRNVVGLTPCEYREL